MALKIHSTRTVGEIAYINAIIYGQSGIGKTVLCGTAPNPLILSAEDGLLSLAGQDIDFVKITKFSELINVYNEITKALKEGERLYETVCFDSLSEVAEVVLAEGKKEVRDPRQAYGTMAEEIVAMVRKFKKLPMHCIFIAKQGRIEDGLTGKQSYGPAFPGQVLPNNIPYLIDLVLAMRMGKHEGKEYRYIQTAPDIQYEAKDRSGALALKEPPDLTAMITKIRNHAKSSIETKK